MPETATRPHPTHKHYEFAGFLKGSARALWFGKKNSNDPTSPDLSNWVQLAPRRNCICVSLEAMGMDSPGFIRDWPDRDPKAETVKAYWKRHHAEMNKRVRNFLATIDMKTFMKHYRLARKDNARDQ